MKGYEIRLELRDVSLFLENALNKYNSLENTEIDLNTEVTDSIENAIKKVTYQLEYLREKDFLSKCKLIQKI